MAIPGETGLYKTQKQRMLALHEAMMQAVTAIDAEEGGGKVAQGHACA